MRGNGGGFVSPLVIERLRRALVMVNIARNGMPSENPQPDVPRANGDVDERVLRLRRRHLPVPLQVARPRQTDRQTQLGRRGRHSRFAAVRRWRRSSTKPEFAPYSKDGKEWIIEGHGVDPDIVVDNDPAKEFRGEDQQLNRAIEEIQNELKTKRYDLPPAPPYPDKNPAKRS